MRFPSRTKLLAMLLLAALAPIGCRDKTTTTTPPREAALSTEPYVDPNGFFKMHYPVGWRVQRYPRDPRGKVAFSCPNSIASLRILAKATQVTSYDSFVKSLRDEQNQLGLDMDIETTTFNGIPAIKRTITETMQDVERKFLWIDILCGSISHSIQYSASPEEFDVHYPIAMKSIETYEPLFQPGDPATPNTDDGNPLTQ